MSTWLSILNHWREEIPDDPNSLPSTNELKTESIVPIQAALDEPEPIGVEAVIDDLQTKGVNYENETIIAEPEVTHIDNGDLFVPVSHQQIWSLHHT